MLMRPLYISLCLLVCHMAVASSVTELDSLKAIVEEMPDDSLRCEVLLRITDLINEGVEAEKYGREALVTAKKVKNPNLLARAHEYLAWVLSYDKMDEKVRHLDSASLLFTATGNLEGLGLVHSLKGIVLMDYEYFGEAEKSLKKSYTYYGQAKLQTKQANILNTWGVLLNDMNKPSEAMFKLQEALELTLAKQPENTLGIGRIYYNMGEAARRSGDFDAAVDYFLDALQYRKKANHTAGVAEVYVGIANTALNARQSRKDTTKIAAKLQVLNVSDFSSLLDSAMALPDMENRKSIIYEVTDLRREHALLEKDYRGAYDLLMQLKKHDEEHKLSSSSLEAFANLKVKYEKEILNSQLLEQEVVNQRKQNEVNLLISFLFVTLAALTIGFLFYQNRMKANKLRLALEQQKRIKAEQEQQVVAIRAMVEGQEKERARIARDLHDGLGNLLSTLKVNVNSLHITFDNENTEKMYSKASEMIDEACVEVRKIAHEMMPQALQRLGLVKALEDLCTKMKKNHAFDVHMDIYGEELTLNDNKNVMLYRIVQELFNNIIKYAEAKEVLLQLTFSEEWLNLTVEDDGKGFDVNNTSASNGMGLKSVAFRTNYIGGECAIDSRPGAGTSVSINVPLELGS